MVTLVFFAGHRKLYSRLQTYDATFILTLYSNSSEIEEQTASHLASSSATTCTKLRRPGRRTTTSRAVSRPELSRAEGSDPGYLHEQKNSKVSNG